MLISKALNLICRFVLLSNNPVNVVKEEADIEVALSTNSWHMWQSPIWDTNNFSFHSPIHVEALSKWSDTRFAHLPSFASLLPLSKKPWKLSKSKWFLSVCESESVADWVRSRPFPSFYAFWPNTWLVCSSWNLWKRGKLCCSAFPTLPRT